MTDHLHNTVSQILAAGIVAAGGSVTPNSSAAELLADFYNLLPGASTLGRRSQSEHKTIQAIYALIVASPAPHNLSTAKLMAAIAGVSAATVGGGALWQAMTDAMVAFVSDGGGGGDSEQVTFMGEAVTFEGDPVTFTPE